MRALQRLLLLALALLLPPGHRAEELHDDDFDEELLTVREHADQPDPAPPTEQPDLSPAPPAQLADPMDQLVENVLQRPAMFEQRLSVHFEVKGTQQLLHIEQGKSPQDSIDAFAKVHSMEEDEKRMTSRAIARVQIEMAWQAQEAHRVETDVFLKTPALFNLSLSVRQDDENDTLVPIPIAQGQTPLEAVENFQARDQTQKLNLETSRRIA